MIPVQIYPVNPNAPSTIPNIGNLSSISSNAPQIPPSISSLPPGSLLQGFVLNRGANGQPVLRTNVGDFLVQSPVFLKIGSEVTIRVRVSGALFRADIIDVDGQPVSSDSKPESSQSSSKEPPSTAANTSQPRSSQWEARQDVYRHNPLLPDLDSQGNVKTPFSLNAVLLDPNPVATKIGLQQSSPLIFQLLKLSLPQPGNTPPPGSSQEAAISTSPKSTAPVQGNNLSGSTAMQPAPPLPQAATTATTVKAAQSYQSHQFGPPSTPTESELAAALAPVKTATPALAGATAKTIHSLTVIGQEKNGDVIVQTPFGLSKITSAASLPVGSILSAQISLASSANSSNPLIAAQAGGIEGAASSSLFRLANEWPALQQIVQLLNNARIGADNAMPIYALPQLNLPAGATPMQLQPMQFASGFFLFFAALQGGDFRSFLGEKSLQQLTTLGQSKLLGQASAEFSQLARLAGDTSGQWQTMFFPVLVDGEVEMVRWFSKRDQSGKNDGDKKDLNATRFIIELNTSILGELQLDGLYQRELGNNKLELVLRSHAPLDAEIQQSIIQIVQDVNETTGLIGHVAFQSTQHFPEHPLEEALKDIPDVMA